MNTLTHDLPRVAVIGAGYFGRAHAQKYAELPGCQLVAIVDSQLDRAAELANHHGVSAYRHHAELVGRVDMVSIVTPVDTHFPIARDCLNAQLHILVEKPVTATREQAAELVTLAQTQRRVLQVGHIERFNPAVTPLINGIAPPQRLHFRRTTAFKTRGSDVDVLLDLMIHDIDLALTIVREAPISVHATGKRVRSPHLDVVDAQLNFNGGRIAQLLASRVATVNQRLIELEYDDGKRFSADLHARQAPGPVPGHPHRDGHDSVDPLKAQLASFIRCALQRQMPRVCGQQALNALDVALRIRAAVHQP